MNPDTNEETPVIPAADFSAPDNANEDTAPEEGEGDKGEDAAA